MSTDNNRLRERIGDEEVLCHISLYIDEFEDIVRIRFLDGPLDRVTVRLNESDLSEEL
jgi:hypothetical protein